MFESHCVILVTWLHVACLHLQAIEIPFLKVTKKVKSMQMFREPVQSAKQVLIVPFTPIPTLSVLHMHTHLHARTHVHACTYTHTHTHTCTRTHTHTHTHTALLSCPMEH